MVPGLGLAYAFSGSLWLNYPNGAILVKNF